MDKKVKKVRVLYGKEGMELSVPASADVLAGQDIAAIPDSSRAVAEALANPIGTVSLKGLLEAKKPSSVAITISDITRPVPNKEFLPAIFEVLGEVGIKDSQVVIIIGTGMHRASTAKEREILLGSDIIKRFEVIDHTADKPETLVTVSDDPLVRVCRRFAEADFKIVTGYIESHFMAGFSGGRKGVFPALVDLETVQRFHGYETLSNTKADTGVLGGNPCHEIALEIAKAVGVDFLFNVAITKDKEIAGIYCGDIEKAHLAGCREVAEWTSAYIEEPYDLVITNGGGYPLDQTFYQTVKGMCCALPALKKGSTVLVVSNCSEGLGSKAYGELMLKYNNDWKAFLGDIASEADKTLLDQWQYQMQARVLEVIGLEKLWFVSDGIPVEIQKKLSLNPVSGEGGAVVRAQRAIDEYVAENDNARIAVISEGPYTMIRTSN